MHPTLYLMRHAKSDWDSGAARDFDRPLAKRGFRDAQLLGESLHRDAPAPEIIYSSPALRARQTIERVCEYAPMDASLIHWEQRIYAAGLNTLLEVIARTPPRIRRLMLVGHNPGLEMLLQYLCPDAPTTNDCKLFTTGNLAEIGLHQAWTRLDRASGDLIRLLRPNEIRRTSGHSSPRK